MPYHETAEVFGDVGSQLRGYLHWPTGEARSCGIVFCYPFAEERKASARIMTLAARAFCSSGFHVLRFDYFGTGESDGMFGDASVRQWVNDIARARKHLQERAALENVGVLGVRFGATLATLLKTHEQPLPFVILWTPLMSGRACLNECMRHLAATRLVVDENGAVGDDGDRQADQGIDLGGYWMPRPFQDEIEAVELPRYAIAGAKRAVVVQFTGRASVAREYADLRDRLVSASGSGRALGFAGRPFWVTASRYDPQALVDKTVEAISECSMEPLRAGTDAP